MTKSNGTLPMRPLKRVWIILKSFKVSMCRVELDFLQVAKL